MSGKLPSYTSDETLHFDLGEEKGLRRKHWIDFDLFKRIATTRIYGLLLKYASQTRRSHEVDLLKTDTMWK